MKIKSILFGFFLLVLVVFIVASKLLNNSVEATSETTKTNETDRPILIAPLFQESCPISASKTVEFNQFSNTDNSQLISDAVAYTMVLRLLNSHGNDPAKIKRLRGYIQQNLGITNSSDILAVFRLASDFKQRTRPLDNQINTIKERYHSLGHPTVSQADQQRLDRLKQDKERVIDDLIADIPRRMSASGKNRLNQSIQERVKSKIRMQ